MTIQNKERECQNSKRISDKVIIKEIQALYKELGYPPHAGQYSRYATAINHFKTTWPEILKMAGINATFCSDKDNVSKEEFAFKVLNLVRSKNLSYLPADKTLRENGIGPTYIYIYKYWGNSQNFCNDFGLFNKREWNHYIRSSVIEEAIVNLSSKNIEVSYKALADETGFDIKTIRKLLLPSNGTKRSKKALTKSQTLLKEIGALYKTLGYPPRRTQFKNSKDAIKIFKTTWPNVLKLVGIKATFDSPKSLVSKEELIFKCKQIIKNNDLVYFPSTDLLIKSGFNTQKITTYWDGIEDLSHSLGYMTKSEWTTYQQHRIISEVIAMLNKEGKPVTYNSLSAETGISIKFLKHLNLPVENKTSKPEIKDELVKKAKRLLKKKKLNYVLEAKELEKLGFSSFPIKKYWGSISNFSHYLGLSTESEWKEKIKTMLVELI